MDSPRRKVRGSNWGRVIIFFVRLVVKCSLGSLNFLDDVINLLTVNTHVEDFAFLSSGKELLVLGLSVGRSVCRSVCRSVGP